MLANERARIKLSPMKTLTVELDEPTYEALVAQAQRTGRSEAELVSDALAPLREIKAVAQRPQSGHSFRDFKPLGVHLKPGALDFDDLLGEMIDESDRD